MALIFDKKHPASLCFSYFRKCGKSGLGRRFLGFRLKIENNILLSYLLTKDYVSYIFINGGGGGRMEGNGGGKEREMGIRIVLLLKLHKLGTLNQKISEINP